MPFYCLRPCKKQPGQVSRDPIWRIENARLLRATVAAGEILEVMPDNQQPATGSKRHRATVEDLAPFFRLEVQIEDDDQIKGGNGRDVGGQVGVHPFDLHPAPFRRRGTAVEGDSREVHCGDLPSLLRQPEGVAALAGTEVERSARLQPTDLLDQELIGSLCPEVTRATITFIPVACLHPKHCSIVTSRWRQPGVPTEAGRSTRVIQCGVGYTTRHGEGRLA